MYATATRRVGMSSRARAPVRAPVRARAIPHRACEPGEACYALKVRSDRLTIVLRDAIAYTRELAEATSSADSSADYTEELRQAWDTVSELSAAVTRTNDRLENCISENDYLNYADADERIAERRYDL
jgi:hypothetical protein